MKKFLVVAAILTPALHAQNQPDRLEWFRDQGFGLFIHWSVDSQLGTVISHSLAGASDDYTNRFFTELPKTFNPRKFHPEDWASLARLAGVRYAVFTAKHHSGFAMWETNTTNFGINRTPFQKDIFGDVLRAFREQGIAPGVYFSPDDFHWLHENNIPVNRGPEFGPPSHPGLLALDQAQLKELMTRYGPIDVVFLDGAPEGLREEAWNLQPKTVVTRGAMTTPEQYLPGVPLEGAWEACITMGTSWQYQPRNEVYKSGYELIRLLFETRAKGGNLLLNVGPKPDGELPIEQEERLRELALWMFVNGESIYGVRPWVVTNEQTVWFTKKKDGTALYAIIAEPWKRGDWKDFVIRSARATDKTEVTVLGQNDKVLEYSKIVPKTTWKQEADGLHIHAMFAQRLQDNYKWPNPLVLKLTNVQPALTPPRVETTTATRNGSGVTLQATVHSLGDAETLEVSFEYRSLKGLDVNERSGTWQVTPSRRISAPGDFSADVSAWEAGVPYEFRAVVKHPVLTMYGESKKVTLR
ncbi:MAG TPA: alpha-L-fucosidase [Bryobacteraceae bacterium]|jgi:alpha-L-fucosidase|nr:alpha-L-fucosidase [Bryobacteraceae bacterium]